MQHDDDVENLYWEVRATEARHRNGLPEPSLTPGRTFVEQRIDDTRFAASVLADPPCPAAPQS